MEQATPNFSAWINESIRAHMWACGSKMGTVVYFKKDGSLRRLTFQLAAMAPRILGTERGVKAAATRKANHPHLMTVYDIHKRDFRTVDLRTVLTVKAGGKLTRYRHARGARFSPGVVLVPVLAVGPGVIRVGEVEG